MGVETRIVAEPDSRSIVLTRTVNAPRNQVFEAWTRPEHVSRWWDPAGKPLAECAIDLRPGGAFRFANDRSAGQERFTGVYREIAPPERLVFESNGSIGTVEFNEDGDVTHIVVTIECESTAERDHFLKMGIDVGTARTLDNLARYLRR